MKEKDIKIASQFIYFYFFYETSLTTYKANKNDIKLQKRQKTAKKSQNSC